MEEDEREAEAAGGEATPTPSSSTRSTAGRDPQTDDKAADDGADKIDVCSERFDPLLALYSPSVSVPFPKIKCFNNVSEYESFLKGGRGRAKPENVEKKRLKARRGVADPERIERLKMLMVNNPVAQPEEGESSTAPRSRRQKPHKNVLTRMSRMLRQNHCYCPSLYSNSGKSDYSHCSSKVGVVRLLTGRGRWNTTFTQTV